jgi:hypothetical protein
MRGGYERRIVYLSIAAAGVGEYDGRQACTVDTIPASGVVYTRTDAVLVHLQRKRMYRSHVRAIDEHTGHSRGKGRGGGGSAYRQRGCRGAG